jgi:endonuclease-3
MEKYKIDKIFKLLSKEIPHPKTKLKYINQYTFLISVVLSAQSTDVSVNKATKNLFKIAKNPKEMVDLGEKNLKKFIKTIGLYNSKAKNIILLSIKLIKKYNNKIPKEFDKLISLPGVGNKTASVYQNAILKLPRIAVDTHVFRVSNRLGIVKTKTADQTQLQLEKIIPEKWRKDTHHLLILHGRRVCKSRNPSCDECSLNKLCSYNLVNIN